MPPLRPRISPKKGDAQMKGILYGCLLLMFTILYSTGTDQETTLVHDARITPEGIYYCKADVAHNAEDWEVFIPMHRILKVIRH